MRNKRAYLLLLCLYIGFSFSIAKPEQRGHQPAFKWKDSIHNFGEVTESGEISWDFEFTNTGDAPLIITNAQTSCGCDVANWNKEMILPGKKGKINYKYLTTGHPGYFTKSISVFANTIPNVVILTAKGDVLPAALDRK